MLTRNKIKPTLQSEEYDSCLALGTKIRYLHPEGTEINREEFRIHMENMCRYNGAIKVLLIDHACLVAILPYMFSEFRRFLNNRVGILGNPQVQAGYAAIHDHPEVIVGDVVTGLKKRLPGYRFIEDRWDRYIHDQLGMPLRFKNKEFVKALDLTARVLEMKVGDHPTAPIAVEKYNAIYDPEMVEIADQIINFYDNDKKWAIIENVYLNGLRKLDEYY